jgi:hypothetical protein
MFRFTRKPSSGSHCQYLAKITHLVQRRYIEVVREVFNIMAVYYYLRIQYTLTHCSAHTPHKL